MTRLRQLAAQNRLPFTAEAVVLWIAVGPWLWSFSAAIGGRQPRLLVFAFGPLAMLIAVLRPAAFVTLAGAVWLMLSPWVLGYATLNAAWINELVSGSLLARSVPRRQPGCAGPRSDVAARRQDSYDCE